MPTKDQNKPQGLKQKAVETAKKLGAVALVTVGTTSMAFAAEGDVSIDLTTGGALAGVSIIAGLMASGSLKAVPTYAAWGIRKALSMLR